jgi:hypothetical protein
MNLELEAYPGELASLRRQVASHGENIANIARWKSQKDVTEILARLNKLYHDLPFDYAGYVLTAIEDIEDIMYKKENTK